MKKRSAALTAAISMFASASLASPAPGDPDATPRSEPSSSPASPVAPAQTDAAAPVASSSALPSPVIMSPQGSGSLIAYATRNRPVFIAATPGKAAFAMMGAFAMMAAGKELVESNNVQDPASGIARQLAQTVAERRSMQVVEPPLDLSHGKVEQLLPASHATYLIDVSTVGWQYGYYPFDFTHFYVDYHATLQVIDAKTRQVVAKGKCHWTSPKEGAPTQSELTDNGAAGLKARLATAAAFCVDQFRPIVGGV